MTATTDSTWVVIWMCVVDYGDGEPSVSMHPNLADALAELHKDYDSDNKYGDVPKHEFLLLVEIEHKLHIQVYPSRVDIARFERVDLDGWNALRDWEKEMEN